jgi:hypothetical protein
MPIPEERLPEIDEAYPEQSNVESAAYADSLAEEDELQFESADADEDSDDDALDNDETSEADTAGFGFGDPAD